MTIVGNIKTLEMVKGYYGIDDNTLCIKNGESLSIGKRTLTFHLTPMVHWPETMMTYVNEDKLIFQGMPSAASVLWTEALQTVN